jgi:hypothetical protein
MAWVANFTLFVPIFLLSKSMTDIKGWCFGLDVLNRDNCVSELGVIPITITPAFL